MKTTQNATTPIETCFGISRHNIIIPLKVVKATHYDDGGYHYKFALNHPNPSDYLKCHQEADFREAFTSPDRPLCDEYTNYQLTLEEAKLQVTKKLRREKEDAMRKVNSINKQLAAIEHDIANLEKEMAKIS
jgi:hypothetical protein